MAIKNHIETGELMRKALVFWGGWGGHDPELVANRFKGILEKEDFTVDLLLEEEVPTEAETLKAYDVIVPICTGGKLKSEQAHAISRAVVYGTGLAGCHGGMCDAYRNDTGWQFMTGGQWVSHPGGDGVEYTVSIARNSSPLTEGLEDFPVKSEHYYLHVDPAVEVLATTRFPLVNYYHASNKPIDMPVIWTKYWGTGRVFYNSLGHRDSVFDNSPTAQELMRRGFLWVAGGKAFNAANGLSGERYENSAKMY
jgi:type 1 glutamine amidotransferase